jgi:3-oxoadipate enol-lactonase
MMPLSSRGLEFEVTNLVPPWRKPGRPVIFNHGIGATRALWSLWLPIIAPFHPVICFDLRGFGNSPALPEAQVDLMDFLIKDLFDVAGSSEPVHLVGESAGGTIVLAAALQRPERVATVTMSNAAFAGSGIGQIDTWQRLFTEGGVKAWSDRMMECRFAPAGIDSESASWFAREQEKTNPSVALELAGMLSRTDLTAQVSSLRRPLLILSPDSSPFVPIVMAAELKSRVPESELQSFPGARHGLPFSHARESANAFLDFLHRKSACRLDIAT